MPHCMVPDYINDSRDSKGVSFHRIPANEKLKKVWLDVVPRKNPRPSMYSYLFPKSATKRPRLSREARKSKREIFRENGWN